VARVYRGSRHGWCSGPGQSECHCRL
jgi:hypothetical protein